MSKPGSRIADRTAELLDATSRVCPPYSLFRFGFHTDDVGLWNRRTDFYALFWLPASAVAFAAIFVLRSPWPDWVHACAWGLVVVSIFRIVELMAFHLRGAIPLDTKRRIVSEVASHPRALILLVANYLEIAMWFACWYALAYLADLLIAPPPAALSLFRESLSMMVASTTGSVTISPNTASNPVGNLALWIALCAQMLLGMLLTLIVVSRVVASVPLPNQRKPGDGEKLFAPTAAEPAAPTRETTPVEGDGSKLPGDGNSQRPGTAAS